MPLAWDRGCKLPLLAESASQRTSRFVSSRLLITESKTGSRYRGAANTAEVSLQRDSIQARVDEQLTCWGHERSKYFELASIEYGKHGTIV